MGLVLSHTIVSLFLYYRNRDRHAHLLDVADQTSFPERLGDQEALSPLDDVARLGDLYDAIREALDALLHRKVNSIVYILDEKSDVLYADKEKKYAAPSKGIIRETLETQQFHVQSNDVASDPVIAVIKAQCKPPSSWNPKTVYCLPVTDEENQKILALLVIEENETVEINKITPLKHKIVGCYRRLCKCHRDSSSNYAPSNASNPTAAIGKTGDKDAILRLCGDLYDQDASRLQLKVIRFLEEQTNAECAFLLLVVPETQELFCQVIGGLVLEEEIKFPGPNSVFSLPLESKKPMKLEDVPLDKRKDIENFVGVKLKSMLCVPVSSRNNDGLIALACVVNKKDAENFTNDDLQAILQCFQYTSTVLTSTLAFQNERKLKLQTQAMLQVARNLFTHLDDLTKLLREIMQEARNLTQAERCSVFLIDKETKELVAEVFDGISTNNKEEHNEIRMPITQGIAGHVATTGNLLNIKDAYSHPMFYRGIDDSTGFRTRNILCFPIKNERGDVLGVAQLCNKKTGQHFTEFDEDLASAFAVYCCISISHCLMYKKLQDSQHRNRLANELMIFHMQISPDDVEGLLSRDIPSVALWGVEFDKFPFPPREIPEPETPLCVLAMFEDLGFLSRWRIRKDTLVRFVLMVKKGYRNPPYHNWTHAFAVAHFCFLCIKNLNLQQSLDDIELFALFVSCLCHDLDHRGTNNQYQVASKSVLAALYSSEGSVMERHHFAQTMCIVNTDGCNIFENLSSKDYTTVLDLVRDIILATDLAHHLKIMNSLKEMAKVGFDTKNERHHSLLLCLLMTASDLSDQTKPWDNTKHVAALIYREFFSQGDMEKSLGQKPAEMMDRERARIPDLQIGFLDHIALPVYKVLADLFPASGIVRDTVVDNRRHWEKICALIKIRRGGSCEQMSYDQILAMEEEEANAEIENYNLQNQKQNGR
ncbi:cGMP-dependent 3',5'-cyclic phosphodiesterase-like isoform X2 [Crassostrea angulata]|uniref:cGMP-dependent 3',5'-cyclic phosphodiesterase-like isoform X2 n=1 Tax=Magallana angulata TaxID=2784310 RepID=UPI0022B0B541|nr:cGMP-dependent 3',5'-cyclic phosphodiesterase-like isoform X2 [Crassostrea angulata]